MGAVKRNPRVQVPVTPEIDAALEALSEASRKPKSKIVADILEEALPTLKAMTDAINAAKSGELSVAEKIIAENLGTTLLNLSRKAQESE